MVRKKKIDNMDWLRRGGMWLVQKSKVRSHFRSEMGCFA